MICVPAKFGLRETKATQEAFERAGMKVMRVLEDLEGFKNGPQRTRRTNERDVDLFIILI